MKNLVALAAFTAGANALVSRTDTCCFHLSSSGGASGKLGQLGDGQNRIGDNKLSPAKYCISPNGGITDSKGRGCILTPPTTQFQCDEGSSPTLGFSIGSKGELEYHGSKDFVGCATGQNGGLNVYTTPNKKDVTGCVNIKLTADACSHSGSSSGNGASSSAAHTSSIAAPPGTGGGNGGAPASSVSAVSTALPGSPQTVMTTVTITDCSCAASGAPGVPGAVGSSAPGGGAAQHSGSKPAPSGGVGIKPSTTASAPSGGAGHGGLNPSGPSSSEAAPPGAGGGFATVPSSSAFVSAPSVGGGGGTQLPGTTKVSAPPGGGGGATSTATVSAPSATGAASGGTQQPTGSPSVSTPVSSASQTPPSTQSATGTCPTTLQSGEYEIPHLIIPIDSSTPDAAPGTSMNGTVTSTVSSLFNFDIPESDAGKTCSLVFLFPHLQDLETSSYSFSGDGKIDFAKLSSVAQESTSFNNAPAVSQDLGTITVSPGNSYVVSSFACPAGEAVAYQMRSAGSTELDFFEDWNPSPLGLFITTC